MAGFNPNDYETVDSRIHRFWEQYPDGRIETSLERVQYDDANRIANVVIRTEIYRSSLETRPAATGYAEETAGLSTAPKASLLETGETSSIGRALATLGLSAKGKRPSREEMQKPERQTVKPNPTNDYVEAAVLKLRANALDAAGKAKLLEEWPAKLAKPIPDRIPPTIYAALEAVLDRIENGEPAAAAPTDDCRRCGTAKICPLGANGVNDPDCRNYSEDTLP